MFKRVFLMTLTLVTAVGCILVAALHPTGPNTVSYDEPIGVWLSIGMTVLLFIPLLVLSFFGNRIVRIISSVIQIPVVISFMGIIPISFFFSKSIGMGLLALFGVIVSIASIVVTLKTGRSREIAS
ncbi:hypothetical protein KV679_00690 [Bacillus sp. JRC01]|nr:hypothetical protein [Bacillus sp. JRC01]